MAIVEVFQQIQHSSNPSLAILAETFRSLNYYRHNKDECFLGCVPLLYIWIMSHVKCEGITFTKSYLLEASSIFKFCKNTWPPPKTEEWWVSSFRDSNQLQWMALWMSQPPLLYQCGNLSWMPLFGLWGMISYAPILTIRQFRAKQFIPAITKLASLKLMYGQPGQAQWLNQMMQAWKDPHKMRLGQIVGGCTLKYSVWRE